MRNINLKLGAMLVGASLLAACGQSQSAQGPACDDDLGSGCAKTSGSEMTAARGEPSDGRPGSDQGSTAQKASTLSAKGSGCERGAVLFATNSAEISPAASERLDALALCISRGELEYIEITGSADPRGPEQYNEALGERRAKAVRNYLRSKGVDEAKYSVKSAGESRASENPAQWPQDRKAKISVDK
jgi:peptidoglycan-associated lipoprotein